MARAATPQAPVPADPSSPRSSRRVLPLLALVGCAVLWSTGGLLIKSVSLSPLAIAGGRSLVAALFLLVATRRIDLRGGAPLWLAAAANALTMLLFVTATRLTTAANAVLLQYTAPVWVVVLGYLLFRERVFPVDLAVLVVVMAGMALFFAEGFSLAAAPLAALGDVLAVVAGVTFGLQAIYMSRLKAASPISAVFLGNVLVVAATVPFLAERLPAPADLVPLLLLGVVQIGAAYLLFTYAVRHLAPLEIILVPILEPVLNPVLVYLVRGERPTASAVAGGALIVAAVTLWCVFRERLLRRLRPDAERPPRKAAEEDPSAKVPV